MACLTFVAEYKNHTDVNFGGGLIFDYALTDNGTTVTLTGQFKLYLAMSSDSSAAVYNANAHNNGLKVWTYEGSPSRRTEWVNSENESVGLATKGSKTTNIGQQIVRTYTKTKSPQTITLYNDGASYAAELRVAGKPVSRISPYSNTDQTFTIPALASYTVSYNANGGTGAPSSQTKWYNETLKLQSLIPTRKGYRFLRWNTKADGTGTNYAAGAHYTANAPLALYAQWELLNLVKVYDENGVAHTGLVTVYDANGNAHACKITAYDKDGNKHGITI